MNGAVLHCYHFISPRLQSGAIKIKISGVTFDISIGCRFDFRSKFYSDFMLYMWLVAQKYRVDLDQQVLFY